MGGDKTRTETFDQRHSQARAIKTVMRIVGSAKDSNVDATLVNYALLMEGVSVIVIVKTYHKHCIISPC